MFRYIGVLVFVENVNNPENRKSKGLVNYDDFVWEEWNMSLVLLIKIGNYMQLSTL